MTTRPETTRPGTTRPEIVAHRGDPVGQVENTLPAIRSAVAAGARIVEIDVRVSSDGVPVLLHDESTARIWGRDARAEDQSLAELAELRADHDSAGHDKADRDSAEGPRIPTLEQALLAAVPARLLIDLPDAASTSAALHIVQELRAAERIPAPAWCGSEEGLGIVRAADPEAEIWLSRGVRELPVAELVAQLRPLTWNPEHVHVDAGSIAGARELGMLTSCWTVDDPTRAAELAELGVHAIISNRSALVRERLEGAGS